MAFDYKKEYKNFICRKKQAELHKDSKMNYIAVREEQSNEKTQSIKAQIGLLYGIAFTGKDSELLRDGCNEGFFEYGCRPRRSLVAGKHTGTDYEERYALYDPADFVTRRLSGQFRKRRKEKSRIFQKVEFFSLMTKDYVFSVCTSALGGR